MSAIRTTVRRAGCVVLLVPSLALAQSSVPFAEQSADAKRLAKQSYSLFRPTPTAMMREFSTDRPDKTESAYTVDAGRVQVELDMLTFSRDRALDAGVEHITTGMRVDPINIKLGLRHNMDLQFVVEPYVRARVSSRVAPSAPSVARWSGTGDLTMRLKINMWGNDGGPTALALMPYVALARAETGQKRQFAGGLIVPIAVDLGGGWGLGAMAQVDVEKQATVAPYHVNAVGSATVGRDLTERVGFYTELWALENRFVDVTATWDSGITYALAPNIQLDGGVNVGLTRTADGVNPFLGLSFRF
jgi:hypothetical protein